MTRGDEAVERAADRLESASAGASRRGGLAAKAAPELAEDASFLRRLKPSLIAARARGEAPTDAKPGASPAAPSGPQLAERSADGGGPKPLAVLGGALMLGIALAKAIDWRSHAHPRH